MSTWTFMNIKGQGHSLTSMGCEEWKFVQMFQVTWPCISKFVLMQHILSTHVSDTWPVVLWFTSPEPKAHWWAYRIGRPPPYVVHTLFNIFSSETTGPIKVKFHMKLLWDGGKKIYSNGLGHMTKLAAMPIFGKNLKKSSSPEPKGRWPWKLVCNIGYSGTTEFVQMMTLGWPWPILQPCQISLFGPLCFCVGKM